MLRELVAKLTTAVSGTRAELSEVRERLDGLAAERRNVEAERVSFDEIQARVNAIVEKAQQDGGTTFEILALREYPHDFARAFSSSFLLNNGRLDVLGLLAWLDPKKLCELLLRGQTTTGLATADRARRLAEIDLEIARLSAMEEMIVRSLEEATNSTIARRAGADVRYVVAMQSDLEKATR